MSEYEALRQEILTNSGVILHVFIIAITGTAAFWGYGIQAQQKKWAIFLCPFAILIPAFGYIITQMGSTIRIATYINTFIEGEYPNLNWERNLMIWRHHEFDFTSLDLPYCLSISILFCALGIISLFMAFIYFYRQRRRYAWYKRILFYLLSISLMVLLVIMSVIFTDLLKKESFEKYISSWETVKYSSSNNRLESLYQAAIPKKSP